MKKKSPPCENFGSLWHAAACCGMLQNPHQQLPESGAAACCGMLRPLVLGCDLELLERNRNVTLTIRLLICCQLQKSGT